MNSINKNKSFLGLTINIDMLSKKDEKFSSLINKLIKKHSLMVSDYGHGYF